MDKQIPLECGGCGTEMGTITVDTKHEAVIESADTKCMDCAEADAEDDE